MTDQSGLVMAGVAVAVATVAVVAVVMAVVMAVEAVVAAVAAVMENHAHHPIYKVPENSLVHC